MGVTYRSNIPAVIKALHTGSVQGVRAVASAIGTRADADCPTASGTMRDSRYTITSDGGNRHAVDDPDGRYTVTPAEPPANDLGVVIAYSAFYAPFVHEGHHTRSGSMVAARPWFLGAMTAVAPQAPNIFSQYVGSALIEAALPTE